MYSQSVLDADIISTPEVCKTNTMDLAQYRASSSEQLRTKDLLDLMPTKGRSALDIGTRDGHFSLLMADRFEEVTALDLTKPTICHPRVHCIEGNAADMPFPEKSFEFVLCAEVLEHIPPSSLQKVCQEIERVASQLILIGVPYKQDLRVGRTTCCFCGKPNPPWGHVNSFDENRIAKLFRLCNVEATTFVGETRSRTNRLSVALMDFSGNPYGTYQQEEACIYCGRRLMPPPPRSVVQKLATRCAILSQRVTEVFTQARGNWIHVMLRKRNIT